MSIRIALAGFGEPESVLNLSNRAELSANAEIWAGYREPSATPQLRVVTWPADEGGPEPSVLGRKYPRAFRISPIVRGAPRNWPLPKIAKAPLCRPTGSIVCRFEVRDSAPELSLWSFSRGTRFCLHGSEPNPVSSLHPITP
jgi:hypothetical protein